MNLGAKESPSHKNQIPPMASTAAYTSQAQVLPADDGHETPYSTPKFRPKSRRNSSFSSLPSPSPSNSSSRSLSFYDPLTSPEFSPSPTTPLRFSGIPFSWEQTPGIPKNQISKKNQSFSHGLLPLPPAGGTNSSFRKSCSTKSIRKDPFVAALMECSKDDDVDPHQLGFEKIMKTSRIAKGFADRLGAISMYTSCKSVGVVSESMVFLSRSRHHHELLKHRVRR